MKGKQRKLIGKCVTQTVKNSPAMQETWVHSLGWEDTLEEGMATHSSILAWKIPMDRCAWQAIVRGGHKELDTPSSMWTQRKLFRARPGTHMRSHVHYAQSFLRSRQQKGLPSSY